MSTTTDPVYKYQVGGSLEHGSPSYVARRADWEFYEALKRGEFCYVFNSRQMGKSSLRVQVVQRLRVDGIVCGIIDLTKIGSYNITDTEWYLGIVRSLTRSFGIKLKVLQWWQEHDGLSPVQRLSEFIEEVLLSEIAQSIVIFIDEIDSVLKFDFKDDFFALIRACYDQRSEQPAYSRLSFALLGVATPSDLIQDKHRTPFNIGRAINLEGFQLQEVYPLIQGLVRKANNPQEVLRVVLSWTGGQPFLTQKLCQLILEDPEYITAGNETDLIERLVQSSILKNWEAQDQPEHLRTIRDRLLQSGEQQVGRLLGLCQQIVQQGEILADDTPEQTELRLTGLVVKWQNKLHIYNRLYTEVFNQAWFERELAKLRPYANELNAWVASHRHDESRLLRGQALQDALNWAVEKSLSDLDYQFLSASQEAEKREVELALELERKQKEAVERANQILSKAQTRAKQLVRFGFVTMSLSIVLGILFILVLHWSAVFLNNRGHEKLTAGQIEEALQNLDLALILKPGYANALYNRAQVYEHLQAFDRAYANYQVAVKQGFAPAYSNLARLQIIYKHDYAKAVELLQQGLQLETDDSTRYSLFKNLGWAQYQLKQYTQAEANLQMAMALDSQRGSAYCLLAQVLEDKGTKLSAKENWRKCLALGNSTHPDESVWINLAKSKLKK